MKKHIRIKVKTLLILIPIIVALFFSNTLYWQGIKLYNAFVPEKYMIALENLSTKSLDSENRRLELIYTENEYNMFMLVTIEDGYMVNGMRISSRDAENIFETFKDYASKYNLYQDYPDYVINVALAQWFSGNSNLALNILDGFETAFYTEAAFLVKSGMYLGLYDFDNALELLKNVQSSEYEETKQNIYYFLNHVMAKDLPKGTLDGFEIKSDHYDPSTYNGKYSHLFSSIYMFNANLNADFTRHPTEQSERTDRSVSGTVTLNGDPIQGAFIYEKTHSGMSSFSFLDDSIIVTDARGGYLLNETYTNLKGVGIAISWHVIHDKQIVRNFHEYADNMKETVYDFKFYDGVRFSKFEIIGNQLHYEIVDPLFGPSRSYVIRARHTDPKYDLNTYGNSPNIDSGLKGVIDLDVLRLNSTFAFNFISSKDELAVERFIEPLYLSGDYAFEVSAYLNGEQDLYVSNGFFTDALYTYAHIEGEDGYSEGDLLIEADRIDDAIKWYDENRSLHALKILASLYAKGTYVEATNEFWQELGGKDADKALYYTELIIEKFGNSEQWLLNLARAYDDAMLFEKEQAVYASLIDLNPNISFYNESYANATIKKGNFMKGLELLDAFDLGQFGLLNKYQYAILAGLDHMLSSPFKEIIEDVDGRSAYSEFHTLIRDGDYTGAKEWLDTMGQGDLKIMYELLLEDKFHYLYSDNDSERYDEFVTYYRESVEKIDSEAILNLLRELKQYHNWFN